MRSLVLVSLKLMGTNLPPSLFSCIHCMGSDGRYKYVSADSIWVGFGSGADHKRFQHVVEPVPSNERAVRAAYRVRGAAVRRVVRDVMKPKKEVKLYAKSLRAAEVALGLLVPSALPNSRHVEPTDGEKAITALLGTVFNLNEAALKLMKAVKPGLTAYKPRKRGELELRAAAAQHLGSFMTSIKSKDTTTVDKAPLAVTPQVGGAAGSTTTLPPMVAPPAASGTLPAASLPSTTASTLVATGTSTPPRAHPSPPAASGSSMPPPPVTPQDLPPAAVPPPPAPPRGLPAAATGRLPVATSSPLTAVVPPPPLSSGRRKLASQGKADADKDPERTTRKRPSCGRQPFRAGKGDIEADNPHLRPAILAMQKDSRRELLTFVTAITIDSVALPFRPRQADTLRQLVEMLQKGDSGAAVGAALARVTSGSALVTSGAASSADESNAVVDLLCDLRFVQLGMRACLSLFSKIEALPTTLARALQCVADAIDKFVLEWRNGPDESVANQNKWECGTRSPTEMCNDFKKAYPQAATSHERTGTCAPSLPQCRPEPFLWEEVLRTGMCSKHYAKAHKFSPGATTFCCGCKHPLILAFTVLDRKEAPQVLLNMLLTRFARLPHFLIYDFACGAFRVALGKLGWLLMDCTIVSDRFHIFNHLCSDALEPRSYKKMDGADTGAPEQRNAPIRRIQSTLQGMGVEPYTNLLAYQTAVLNHEAQTKWELDVDRLPENADLAGEFFSRFPCLCCDGASRDAGGDVLAEGAISEGDGEGEGDLGERGESGSDTRSSVGGGGDGGALDDRRGHGDSESSTSEDLSSYDGGSSSDAEGSGASSRGDGGDPSMVEMSE